uniref:Uncharacterized protein n=1 Tax=Arundo donax TaxID=35708 RepID=A0A0A9EZU3_ARUDO
MYSKSAERSRHALLSETAIASPIYRTSLVLLTGPIII